jgi:hypothetical protein
MKCVESRETVLLVEKTVINSKLHGPSTHADYQGGVPGAYRGAYAKRIAANIIPTEGDVEIGYFWG